MTPTCNPTMIRPGIHALCAPSAGWKKKPTAAPSAVVLLMMKHRVGKFGFLPMPTHQRFPHRSFPRDSEHGRWSCKNTFFSSCLQWRSERGWAG